MKKAFPYCSKSKYNAQRKTNLVSEEIENCAQFAAVSSEKLSITAALTDNSSILAALNVKNFTPESAGHPHFANFTNVISAF